MKRIPIFLLTIFACSLSWGAGNRIQYFSEPSWGRIQGMPEGFADGIDDVNYVPNSTEPVTLSCGGDISVSTSPGDPALSSCNSFYTGRDTWVIVDMEAFVTVPSSQGYVSCSSTMNAMISSGSALSGDSGITWRAVDPSSYSVRYDQMKSTGAWQPATVNIWNAGTYAYLFQATNHNVCGGRAPRGVWGLYIRKWVKNPGQ